MGSQRPQIDHIFFGGHKTLRPEFTLHGEQALDFTIGVGVMIAESNLCRWGNTTGSYLGEELFGTSNPTKHNWRSRSLGQH